MQNIKFLKVKESCIPCKNYILTGPRRCKSMGNNKSLVYHMDCPCSNCIVKVTCQAEKRIECPMFLQFIDGIIIENTSKLLKAAIDEMENCWFKYTVIEKNSIYVLNSQSEKYQVRKWVDQNKLLEI